MKLPVKTAPRYIPLNTNAKTDKVLQPYELAASFT